MTALKLCLLILLMAAGSAPGQPPPLPPPTAAGAAQPPVKLPMSWLNKAKGYEKALELQKQTGADILIYFSRQAPENEKGLCNWFENATLTSSKLKDYLRDYIKVDVPLPSNPDCQKLAQDFDVRKCPAVFVVQPNGLKNYVKVFDWPGGKPKPYEPEELIEFIRARSSARYQKPDSASNETQPGTP